jgi:hypothetical protein
MPDDNLTPLQQLGSLLPVVCNALEFSFWMYVCIMLLDVGMVVEFSHMSLGLELDQPCLTFRFMSRDAAPSW